MVEQWRTQGIASVRRIVATLLSTQPRLAYQRDVMDATAQWPRRYSAEGLTISLQVERTPQHAHQRGSLQLLGFVTSDGKALEDLQGTSVLLSSQTKVGDERDLAVRSQVIDDLGNFLFSALEPDTYVLEFQLPKGGDKPRPYCGNNRRGCALCLPCWEQAPPLLRFLQ